MVLLCLFSFNVACHALQEQCDNSGCNPEF